jgi:hypothetical protein
VRHAHDNSGFDGKTEDAFISHLAVATNAGHFKVGSFARSERMVEWNEVLRTQRDFGERAALLVSKKIIVKSKWLQEFNIGSCVQINKKNTLPEFIHT